MNSKNRKKYSKKKSLIISINDILDELMVENKRLLNELLFANKLKTHLIKIHSKYETLIDCEDKQHFQTLSTHFKTDNDHLFGHQLQDNDNYEYRENGENNGYINVGHRRQLNSSEEVVEELDGSLVSIDGIKEESFKSVVDDICDEMLSTVEYNCPQNDGNESYIDIHGNDVFTYLNHDFSDNMTVDDIKQEVIESNDGSGVRPRRQWKRKYISEINKERNHKKMKKKLRSRRKLNESKSATEVVFNRTCNESDVKPRNTAKDSEVLAKTMKENTEAFNVILRQNYRNLTEFKAKMRFRCPVNECRSISRSMETLNQHLRAYHNIDRITQESFWEPLSCTYAGCDYKSRQRQYLELHFKTIHKNCCNYTCDECGKTFMAYTIYSEHKRTHSLVPTIRCGVDDCEELFHTRHGLQRHREAEHGYERKEDPCYWPGCAYVSKTGLDRLKEHIKLVHQDIRPEVCDWPECGKRFADSKRLQDHVNMHLKIKPHACHWPGCTFRCTLRCNINKHMKKHLK